MGYRLAMAVILSVTLIIVDVRFDQLDPVRRTFSSGMIPVQWLSDLPNKLGEGLVFLFTSRDSLEDEFAEKTSLGFKRFESVLSARILPPNFPTFPRNFLRFKYISSGVILFSGISQSVKILIPNISKPQSQ